MQERRDKRELTAFESMLAGGVAGAISKTAIAPGDRVKILFQVSSKQKFSVQAAFRTAVQIIRDEGPTGLWRGNGAMMIRVIPYASITFMTFDKYQKLYCKLLERCAIRCRFASRWHDAAFLLVFLFWAQLAMFFVHVFCQANNFKNWTS